MKLSCILFSLFIGALLLVNCGCSEEKICDYETQQCHTKAEWEEVSRQNFELVRCIQKQIDKGRSIDRAAKACKATIRVRIDFK